MQSRVYLYGVILSMLMSGYLLGRASAWHTQALVPFFSLSHGEVSTMPTVSIDGLEDGRAVGQVHGNVRLLVGGTLVTGTGHFAVPAGALLTNRLTIIIPDWAQFAASKQGSKYYPVFSKSAERLSPANRVYFRTAEDAEKAGYRK